MGDFTQGKNFVNQPISILYYLTSLRAIERMGPIKNGGLQSVILPTPKIGSGMS